jgi:hypothetical protein
MAISHGLVDPKQRDNPVERRVIMRAMISGGQLLEVMVSSLFPSREQRGHTVQRKGIRSRSLNRDGDSVRGNAKELGDAGGSPEKSSLFFLTVEAVVFFFFGKEKVRSTNNPGIGSPGERVRRLGKRLRF